MYWFWTGTPPSTSTAQAGSAPWDEKTQSQEGFAGADAGPAAHDSQTHRSSASP